jgi:hypothetical protein
MLNLFNNNNYSLLDNNLFSYGLILGSVSILGFSLYYYFNGNHILNNSSNDNVSTTSSNDNVSTTSSNETADQTINNVEKHYVDSSSQTDDTMLYDYLNERIMENMTPSASSFATQYSPTEIIREYETNPYFTNYIDNIVSWSNNTANSVGNASRVFKNGIFPTTNSEHQYVNMMEMIRDIRRSLNGNVVRDYFFENLNSRLVYKLHEIVNTKISASFDQISNLYTSLSVPLTDSNVNHVADLIVRSINTFS